MNLYAYTEDERRSDARKTLEALEIWLRRFVDVELSKEFGINYFYDKKTDGQNIINNDIQSYARDPLKAGLRPINAILLEHLITILCNHELYNSFFKQGLKEAYPCGSEELRTFLNRLKPLRNDLSHANFVSIRNCERIICYSHDIIDSLKNYYSMQGQQDEYNVPRIIKVTDNFQEFKLTELNSFSVTDNSKYYLYPGDTLTIEIEVDPTFDETEYEVKWEGNYNDIEGTGKKFMLPIQEKYITETLDVICKVISTEIWHRNTHFDDQFHCQYKVLPLKDS